MRKEIAPYEIGRILILLGTLLSLAGALYGLYVLIWNAAQLVMEPLGIFLEKELTQVTEAAAKSGCIKGAVLFVVCLSLFFVAKDQIRRQQLRFKRKFMPQVLKQDFSDFTYDAPKCKAREETLCDMGLLRYSERYYSANRLQGIYQDCWVAAEEIACGGVYGEHYTGHKVKVRGQWLTIRLNRDFEGPVILECRGSKNRLTHRRVAREMCEIQFDDQAFADSFRCFAPAAEEAYSLISRQLAAKLVAMLERYPDFSVFFYHGCMHILLRRRSFNRRLEALCPFSLNQLQAEAARLYGPLQDFTRMLLT